VTLKLQANPKWGGLSDAEVAESRKLHGSNILTPPEREPWWKLFLEKFDDPVIRILMIAAFIAIGVGIFHGQYLEGVGIITAVLLATTIAFVNEYRATKEFDILNKSNDDVPIKVSRGGRYTTVPRKDVVVGDVVLVEIGEAVPADGELLEAVSLQVNEASLTGESLPATKTVSSSGAPAGAGANETAYPPHRLYRGTTLVDGHGVIRITAVGDATQIGGVMKQAGEEDTGEVTPLNTQLEKLSKIIGVVGFGIAGLTFVALIARGLILGNELQMTGGQWAFIGILFAGSAVALVKVWLPVVYDGLELIGRETSPPEWLEAEGIGVWVKTIAGGAVLFAAAAGACWAAGVLPGAPGDWLPLGAGQAILAYFMIAVTIIVVAVPEGLAMSVTLSLAYSMRKMTATNNLVRKMHACETIGAATVICSDKTGTLTMNQMKVHTFQAPGIEGEKIGAGAGSLAARLLVEAICANSTANLEREPGQPATALGNPTESALLLWLDEHGLDYLSHRDSFRIEDQLTFSTERKFMRTGGVSAVTGKRILYVKGAPEVVLARCSRVHTKCGVAPLGAERAKIEQGLQECQLRGMRTLGLAYVDIADGVPLDVRQERISDEKVWLGFAAIADPVRPEVPDAIRACRAAGIAVKIVTGDNPHTAREVGRQIGLLDEGADGRQLLSGAEFEKLPDDKAKAVAQDLKVLSRARPADKVRIVRTLQDQGHVVAVTGDGTNDAPALNYANVGLSMGRTGTSVAKEASDIILLDDSFRSIVNAVMWGRSLYLNIQRFILFQLTINVAALVIAMLGPFIGVQIPLTVIQMLWINLIMDTFAALALATEPPDPAVMSRPPRQSGDFIVTRQMAKGIFGLAAVFIVFLVGLLLYMQNDGQVTARELTIFYTLFVLLQFWNLFNARRLGSSASALRGLKENPAFLCIAVAILVGQILITQFGGGVFKTVPLSFTEWVYIIAGTSVVLWGGELMRWNMRRAAAGDTLST
jgi:Ca2+-transporting ATPase